MTRLRVWDASSASGPVRSFSSKQHPILEWDVDGEKEGEAPGG